MKEKPIIFNGEMVRAILGGRKTQTRRVISKRIQPVPGSFEIGYSDDGEGVLWFDDNPFKKVESPYGRRGDHLWIREKQRVIDTSAVVTKDPLHIKVRYMADDQPSEWIKYPARLKGVPKIGKCLPYGGYRESSRILLEVLDVRVERVQEITHDDAVAEGIERTGGGRYWLGHDYHKVMKTRKVYGMSEQAFRSLWQSINAKRGYGWDSNPWVWVVEFKVVV